MNGILLTRGADAGDLNGRVWRRLVNHGVGRVGQIAVVVVQLGVQGLRQRRCRGWPTRRVAEDGVPHLGLFFLVVVEDHVRGGWANIVL